MLFKVDNGRLRRATPEDVIAEARALYQLNGQTITRPDDAMGFLESRLTDLEHEVFCVAWLTARHQVIEFEIIFEGTVDGASVFPREIVKSALRHNAAAAVLAHNHPSGCSEPSRADVKITERLTDALGLIGVRTLDHIIIGRGGNNFSFANNGRMTTDAYERTPQLSDS